MRVIPLALAGILLTGPLMAAELVTQTSIDIREPVLGTPGTYGRFKAHTISGQVLVTVMKAGIFSESNNTALDQDGLQKVIDAAVMLYRETYGTEPTIPAAP